MERWNDQGFVLSVRPHGEGGAVVSLLTQNHGRHAGYIYGGLASSRLRPSLQQGAKLYVSWQAQTEQQLGTYTLEDDTPPNPEWLADPERLKALQSICVILERALPEREAHPSLFAGTAAFLDNLSSEREIWAASLVIWELSLLRELGFGLNLSKCVVTGDTQNLTHISPKSGGAVSANAAKPYESRLLPFPLFLQGAPELSELDLYNGLKLSAYFLEHRLFSHTTHTLPDVRLRLLENFTPKNSAP